MRNQTKQKKRGEFIMRIKFHLLIAILLQIPLLVHSKDYYIKDYGAKPSLGFINTTAINNAIVDCSNNGGGRVIIPQGTYMAGTIFLKNNVDLHLQQGAILKASSNLEDLSGRVTTGANTENVVSSGLIVAINSKNISITGDGTIDMSSEAYKIPGEMHISGRYEKQYIRQGEDYLQPGEFRSDGPVKMKERPGFMIYLIECENIAIRNVKIINSPHWAIRIADSRDITINNVDLFNDPMIPNSDGIHFTCSENILVSNCNLSCGDDAICFTGFGEMGKPTQNVVVNNCILQSRSAAIRIGYGATDIKNLTFSNIVIKESNRGIGIFTRNEGSVSNVLFSNIVMETRLHAGWWGNGEPIHISAIRQEEQGSLGSISNIRFDNVMATAEHGIVIYGDEKNKITDVSFENVKLSIHDGKESLMYGGNFDLRPTRFIKDEIFEHDIAAIFCKNVNNLSIDDFDLIWGDNLAGYFTYGIECHNSLGINIDAFSGSSAKTNLAPIFLQDSKVDYIQNCFIKGDPKNSIERTGLYSNSGIIVNNRFDNEEHNSKNEKE